MRDYRRFVGLDYEPPFGCFELVRRVYQDAYGIDLGPLDGDPTRLTAELHRLIAEHGREVADPREGDIILLRSAPWHVGVVLAPPKMLHCWEGGTSCIESWLSLHWRSRIVGFYRYGGGK